MDEVPNMDRKRTSILKQIQPSNTDDNQTATFNREEVTGVFGKDSRRSLRRVSFSEDVIKCIYPGQTPRDDNHTQAMLDFNKVKLGFSMPKATAEQHLMSRYPKQLMNDSMENDNHEDGQMNLNKSLYFPDCEDMEAASKTIFFKSGCNDMSMTVTDEEQLNEMLEESVLNKENGNPLNELQSSDMSIGSIIEKPLIQIGSSGGKLVNESVTYTQEIVLLAPKKTQISSMKKMTFTSSQSKTIYKGSDFDNMDQTFNTTADREPEDLYVKQILPGIAPNFSANCQQADLFLKQNLEDVGEYQMPAKSAALVRTGALATESSSEQVEKKSILKTKGAFDKSMMRYSYSAQDEKLDFILPSSKPEFLLSARNNPVVVHPSNESAQQLLPPEIIKDTTAVAIVVQANENVIDFDKSMMRDYAVQEEKLDFILPSSKPEFLFSARNNPVVVNPDESAQQLLPPETINFPAPIKDTTAVVIVDQANEDVIDSKCFYDGVKSEENCENLMDISFPEYSLDSLPPQSIVTVNGEKTLGDLKLNSFRKVDVCQPEMCIANKTCLVDDELMIETKEVTESNTLIKACVTRAGEPIDEIVEREIGQPVVEIRSESEMIPDKRRTFTVEHKELTQGLHENLVADDEECTERISNLLIALEEMKMNKRIIRQNVAEDSKSSAANAEDGKKSIESEIVIREEDISNTPSTLDVNINIDKVSKEEFQKPSCEVVPPKRIKTDLMTPQQNLIPSKLVIPTKIPVPQCASARSHEKRCGRLLRSSSCERNKSKITEFCPVNQSSVKDSQKRKKPNRLIQCTPSHVNENSSDKDQINEQCCNLQQVGEDVVNILKSENVKKPEANVIECTPVMKEYVFCETSTVSPDFNHEEQIIQPSVSQLVDKPVSDKTEERQTDTTRTMEEIKRSSPLQRAVEVPNKNCKKPVAKKQKSVAVLEKKTKVDRKRLASASDESIQKKLAKIKLMNAELCGQKNEQMDDEYLREEFLRQLQLRNEEHDKYLERVKKAKAGFQDIKAQYDEALLMYENKKEELQVDLDKQERFLTKSFFNSCGEPNLLEFDIKVWSKSKLIVCMWNYAIIIKAKLGEDAGKPMCGPWNKLNNRTVVFIKKHFSLTNAHGDVSLEIAQKMLWGMLLKMEDTLNACKTTYDFIEVLKIIGGVLRRSLMYHNDLISIRKVCRLDHTSENEVEIRFVNKETNEEFFLNVGISLDMYSNDRNRFARDEEQLKQISFRNVNSKLSKSDILQTANSVAFGANYLWKVVAAVNDKVIVSNWYK